MRSVGVLVAVMLTLWTGSASACRGWRTLFEDREFKDKWDYTADYERPPLGPHFAGRYRARADLPVDFELCLESAFPDSGKKTELRISFSTRTGRSSSVSIDNRGLLSIREWAFDMGGETLTKDVRLAAIKVEPGVTNMLRMVSRGTTVSVSVNDAPAVTFEGYPPGRSSAARTTRLGVISDVDGGSYDRSEEEAVKLIWIKVTSIPWW